jgi:hypothetical protein
MVDKSSNWRRNRQLSSNGKIIRRWKQWWNDLPEYEGCKLRPSPGGAEPVLGVNEGFEALTADPGGDLPCLGVGEQDAAAGVAVRGREAGGEVGWGREGVGQERGLHTLSKAEGSQ